MLAKENSLLVIIGLKYLYKNKIQAEKIRTRGRAILDICVLSSRARGNCCELHVSALAFHIFNSSGGVPYVRRLPRIRDAVCVYMVNFRVPGIFAFRLCNTSLYYCNTYCKQCLFTYYFNNVLSPPVY